MASAILTVTGTVTIRERVAIPAGSVATVKLTDASGEVLAAGAVDVAGVPAPFTLTADPAFVADPAGLLLWAALRTDVGTWGTLELVPVDGDTAVLLTKIDDD